MVLSKIKEYKFLTEQIEVIDAKLRTMSPDDKDYTKMLYYREKYVKARAELAPNIDWGVVAQVGIAAGSLYMTYKGYELMKDIAALSYGCDEQMMLCNGRVFNTANSVFRMMPNTKI